MYAFLYTVWVCHSFPSKEEASFNFMAALTVCSDFGAQENKVCHYFHCFPIYLPWSDGTITSTSFVHSESEEELKSLLMKVKEESRKDGLKLSIQKTNIMASSPITSWQIDGETVETVRDFIFGGFKITADDDCSHEIERGLLLGRKALTNPDSILKRHYTADKGPSSQSCGVRAGL